MVITNHNFGRNVEVVIVYFKVKSQNLGKGTEETQKNLSQKGQSPSGSKPASQEYDTGARTTTPRRSVEQLGKRYSI
jgi:hypothetical protein